jgi:hypothetical protein
MHKLTGRFPRLTYYVFIALSLALASGAGRKYGVK